MAWIYLVLAGMCEMVWPVGFKYTHGFTTRGWAAGVTGLVMLVSFALLAQAIKAGVPMGTAYAVWTGIGAAGTAVIGMMMFGDSREAGRLVCLGLIIAGAVGLKVMERVPEGEGVKVESGK